METAGKSFWAPSTFLLVSVATKVLCCLRATLSAARARNVAAARPIRTVD
jgi:hypothetical protein